MVEETVHKSTRLRSRSAIAAHLRRVAESLEAGDSVPVDGTESVTVEPPDESQLAVAIERKEGTVAFEIEMAWPEGEVETGARSGATFELYRDRADEWRWRLVHANGESIADSGEGYARKADARNGIRSVKTNAPSARVEEAETETETE